MSAIRTHFPIKGIRTDVVATPVEDNCFSVKLESTDAFDQDTDPKNETVAAMHTPNMIVQKTKTSGWIVIDPGTFDLSQQEVQELGKAIENNSRQAL